MPEASRRRVAVTGVGMVAPMGGGAGDFFDRLMRAESAVAWYRHPTSPKPFAQAAVSCSDFSPEGAIGQSLTTLTDRFSQLGLAAALSAWSDAALPAGTGAEDAGVSWATGAGGSLTYEKGYADFYERGRDRVSPLSVAMAMNNAAASHIAIALGLGGPCLTYSVACASSAIAIGEAFRRIQSGEARLVVAGGSEAPLSFSIMRAWEAMRVISPATEDNAARACRPFQKGRSGLVLGEGAAALVLEDWQAASARGARIYCELAGYGQSSDHGHLVRPDARGQARAIRAALRDAALATDEVDYLNAHGTATRDGDPIEIEAIRQAFGTDAARLPVSATKSMHGHWLGATGALEALITVLAVARQQIPPTAHLDEVDPDCTGVRHVAMTGLHGVPVRAAISNAFAFGGSNAVLAFRRCS